MGGVKMYNTNENYMTKQNMIFSPDPWIDTSTGEFRRAGRARKADEQELAGLLRGVIEDTFYEVHKYQLGDGYTSFTAKVAIRFSDDIRGTIKNVHPGIGGAAGYEAEDRDIPGAPDERDKSSSRDRVIEVKSLLLGRFSPSSSPDIDDIGTIWLYPKAIAEFANNNAIDYTVVFFAALVREAFHALHYSLFKKAGVSDRWKAGTKLYRDIVKESLASIYEHVFLFNHEDSGLDRLSSRKLIDLLAYEWRNYDIDDHPASGALVTGLGRNVILPDGTFCGEMLKMSLYDWKTAADIIRTGYYLEHPEIRDRFRLMSY